MRAPKSTLMATILSLFFLSLGLSLGLNCLATVANAQGRGGEEKSPEDKAKEEDQWNERSLNLKRLKAAGPCPFVKILYDAARYHEFENNIESLANAKWTGEIHGLKSDCAYKDDDPIQVAVKIGFSLGRGSKAESLNKDYKYWVAVTSRDKMVIWKEEFVLPVRFAPGQERVEVNSILDNIIIPRKDQSISGANFEILIGFDVTEQMINFNRDGKQFRYVTPAAVKQP